MLNHYLLNVSVTTALCQSRQRLAELTCLDCCYETAANQMCCRECDASKFAAPAHSTISITDPKWEKEAVKSGAR